MLSPAVCQCIAPPPFSYSLPPLSHIKSLPIQIPSPIEISVFFFYLFHLISKCCRTRRPRHCHALPSFVHQLPHPSGLMCEAILRPYQTHWSRGPAVVPNCHRPTAGPTGSPPLALTINHLSQLHHGRLRSLFCMQCHNLPSWHKGRLFYFVPFSLLTCG